MSHRCGVLGVACKMSTGPATHSCRNGKCGVPVHNLCAQAVLGSKYEEGRFYCCETCRLIAEAASTPATVSLRRSAAPPRPSSSAARIRSAASLYSSRKTGANTGPPRKMPRVTASPIMASFASSAPQTAGVNRVGEEESGEGTDGDGGGAGEVEEVEEVQPDSGGENRADDEVTEILRATITAMGSSSGEKRSRKPQVVTAVGQREKVKAWMMQQEDMGTSKIPSKALLQFPDIFRFADHLGRQSCLKKAQRYLNEAKKQLAEAPSIVATCATGGGRRPRNGRKNGLLIVTRRVGGVRKQIRVKARPGRGRKRQRWVVDLYDELLEEFRHARRAGIKMNHEVLKAMALNLIRDAPEGCSFHRLERDAVSKRPIREHVDIAFVKRFCQTKDIVQRCKAGKPMCSAKKQAETEHNVVVHLANLKRKFDSGEYDEDCVFNMDETALKVDMDTGRTLDFEGESHVSYMATTSGSEGFTFVMNLGGGRQGTMEPGFIIFKNADCNYPIRNVPDNVPGVSYRTGKKAWMDMRVFLEMIKERKFLKPLPGGKKRILFMDNVGSHKLSDEILEALAEINTEIKFLPTNSTNTTQACDAFGIQVFKQCWRGLWDAKKADDILNEMFRDGKGGSGHHENPGKHFFLKLAAKALHKARSRRDSNGLTYARKSMIICGLSLDTDGVWRESQLRPELQDMISRNRELFDRVVAGLDPESSDEEASGDLESDLDSDGSQ